MHKLFPRSKYSESLVADGKTWDGCYVFIAEKFNVLFDRKRLERYFHLFTPVAELTM